MGTMLTMKPLVRKMLILSPSQTQKC